MIVGQAVDPQGLSDPSRHLEVLDHQSARRDDEQRASAWALGVNWYLNRNFKVNLDYENTWFNGGGGGSTKVPLDRETERVLFTRFQIAY